jgi:uncharacterized membrane protein HdeD (DUF308 family)
MEKGVSYFHEVEITKKHWRCFLGLSVLMIVLGLAALSASVLVTVFSVFFLGLALIGSGVLQVLHGFWARSWSAVFLSIGIGIVYVLAGIACAAAPIASALVLTAFAASFCVVSGALRMGTALFHRFHNYGWIFFHGLVTFFLGILIFAGWPASGLWIIGMFIGVDLLLLGTSWAILALSIREE